MEELVAKDRDKDQLLLTLKNVEATPLSKEWTMLLTRGIKEKRTKEREHADFTGLNKGIHSDVTNEIRR